MNKPSVEFKAESREYPGTTFFEVVRYINGKKEFGGEIADDMEDAERKASKMNADALQAVNPCKGSKGTVIHYTDRTPCTVVNVSEDGKTVWVRTNKTEIITPPVIVPGGFAGHCTEPAKWRILDGFEGVEQCFTFRKNGKFVEKGSSARDGLTVTFFYHLKFYDYNF